jgi:hypothetical protein
VGKSQKTPYQEYYISFDMAVCHGPIDHLVQLYFEEKPVLPTDNSGIAGPSIWQIDEPDLFGGNEREGGIVGTAAWRIGDATQVLPPELARKMQVSASFAPGYRGIACLALYGDDNSDREGAVVADNNPRVPSVWMRLRRYSATLGNNTNVILAPVLEAYLDSNPANIIHEVLTNPFWGAGASADEFDVPKWLAAAQTLYDEKLGLSVVWTRQGTVEDFVQEVLDHINGMVFFDPYAGKAVLKLVRDDYDRDSLPLFGPDNCELTSYKDSLWGETANEVVVTWTDPLGELSGDGASTITYQEPGNIAMQGDVVSVNRNYYMVQNAELAARLCMRELQTESAPLRSVNLEVMRSAWFNLDGSPILPGDVVKFKWEPYNIEQLFLRVLNIDWGTVDQSTIQVELIEDIFSFQLAEFALPGGPEWEDPGQDPDSSDYLAIPAKFFAAPISLIQQDFGADAAPYLADDSYYPQILIGVCVTPLPGSYDDKGALIAGQPDLQSFEMWTPGTDLTGAAGWDDLGEKQLTGKGQLKVRLVQEVISTLFFENKMGGDGPQVGRYAIIGDGSEYTDEWILFEEKVASNTWRVRRGVLDTVPHIWEVGTSLYFISESFDAYDTGTSLAFHDEQYKLQPRTSKGFRTFEGVVPVTTNRPDRPYLPYRPANVLMAGKMFGLIDESQLFDRETSADDTNEPREHWVFHITWSRRNRKLEDSVVYRWDDADLLPEDGQTTSILVYGGPDATGPLVDRIDGITGTDYDFSIIEHTATLTNLSLKFISQRDGYDSLQGLVLNLDLYIKGFGSDYGWLYGGWPASALATHVGAEIELPGITVEGVINEV